MWVGWYGISVEDRVPVGAPGGSRQAAAVGASASRSPGSSGYQQATSWPSPTGESSGRSFEQFSGTTSTLPETRRALGQRGWNEQPDGGSTGDGTSPVSTMR